MEDWAETEGGDGGRGRGLLRERGRALGGCRGWVIRRSRGRALGRGTGWVLERQMLGTGEADVGAKERQILATLAKDPGDCCVNINYENANCIMDRGEEDHTYKELQ